MGLRQITLCCAVSIAIVALLLHLVSPQGADIFKVSPRPPSPDSGLEADGRSTRTRIACVGDSITQGRPFGEPWPDQLQELLGSGHHVMNFGNGGKYMQRTTDFRYDSIGPYWDTQTFKDAMASQPDVVLIMLGTNDGRSWIWSPERERAYREDYRSMVDGFKGLPSRPEVLAMFPPPLYLEGTMLGMNQTLINSIIPGIIRRVAKEAGIPPPVDVTAAFLRECPDVTQNNCEIINKDLRMGPVYIAPDGCHPNTAGLALISRLARDALPAGRGKA